MRKNLKTAAIINFVLAGVYFLGSLFLGYFAFIIIAFLLISGVFYINYSQLGVEDLYSKKDNLICFGIISLFANIISGVIILITCKGITNEYYMFLKNKDMSISLKKQNKSKIMFIVGSIIVVIAGFLLSLSNYNAISDMVKIYILFGFTLLFITLFILSKYIFKIKSISNLYFILSCAFVVLIFLSFGRFNIFGSWYSFYGEGKNIYFASLFSLIAILSLIIYKVLKIKAFNYATFISLFITFYQLVNYFIAINSIKYLVFAIVLLFLNIFLIGKNYFIKVLSIISLIFTYIYTLSLCFAGTIDNLYIYILVSIINLISLYYATLKHKNSILLIFLSIFSNSLILLCVFNINNYLDVNTSVLVVIDSILLLISYFISIMHDQDNKAYQVANFEVFNIIFLVLFVISCSLHDISLLAVGLLIITSSLITVMITKSKIEYYSAPFKTAISLICVLAYLYNAIVIEINSVYAIFAIIIIILHIFTKDNILKLIYYILSIISLFILLIVNSFNHSDMFIIINLLGFIFMFIISLVNKYKILKILSFIFMKLALSISLIGLGIFNINKYINIAILFIIFTSLAIIFRKNKALFFISNIFIVHTIMYFVITFDIYYLIVIVNVLSSIYLLILINILFVKNVLTRSILYTVFLSIIMLSIVFNDNIVIAVFTFLLAVIILIIGILYEQYKSLIIVGLTSIIIYIIYHARNILKVIPLWAYLLILGLVIIIVVSIKEIKNTKKSSN